MKTLQIMWLGTIGGLEKHVLHLVEDLKANGHLVEVCILHKTGAISDELYNRKIKTYFMDMKSGFDVRGALRFKRFLRDNSYDIIHVHDRNILANFVLWKFCETPKVFSEHGGELIGNKPWKRILFYKLLSFQYKKIIANSNHIREFLLKCGLSNEKKVTTIYNGINFKALSNYSLDKNKIRKKLNIDRNNKIIGIVARLVPSKGIDLFILTAQEIAKKDRSFTFLIIGDGPNRSEYEEMAIRVRDKVDIRFLGWRKDIERILPIFDIFLFTSRWESFGIVLLEAMAAGVPIVGFDIPGANEVVEKGETALLVDFSNIKELASTALYLISNKDLYIRLSLNGRKRVRRYFSMKDNAQRTLQIYEEIIKNRG